jgi:hypothetical protein
MSGTELETHVRSNLARTAAGFPDPEQTRQRLLDRNYRPRTANRRLTVGITAAAAATLAAVLGLSGVFSAAHPARPAQLAPFTLVSNSNGTTTLTLNTEQFGNAASLQQALAQHGIPALVNIGSFCSSNPQPPDNGVVNALSKTELVINPALLPAGTELSFGFFPQERSLAETIIDANAYTCASSPPGF